MKVGIMQPYFFPYVGYWQLMSIVDYYVIYDDVNYIKGGWINRNRILMNGQPIMINVRLKGASPNKLISEIEVDNNETYKMKLLKTIEQCYKKAPYFDNVFPLIKEIILSDSKMLANYLTNSITRIARYLGLSTKFILSSEIKKDNSLKGEEKVIEICKILKATEYYNAIGGKELYCSKSFETQGIKLYFVEPKPIEYTQLNHEFVPSLSIIDVVMFNSIEHTKNLLSQYELK